MERRKAAQGEETKGSEGNKEIIKREARQCRIVNKKEQKNVRVERRKKNSGGRQLGQSLAFCTSLERIQEYCRLKELLLCTAWPFHSTHSFSPPVTSLQCLVIVTYRSPLGHGKEMDRTAPDQKLDSLCSLALSRHSTQRGQSLILHESGDLARARVVIVRRLKCW